LWGRAGAGASATSTSTSPIPTTTGTAPRRPPRDPDDPPPDPEPGNCPSTTPIDATSLPYAPPAVSPGACTTTDVDAFIAFVDKDGDPRDWKSVLSTPACKSCVFGLQGASTWAPILEDGAGNPIALNVGGCMALSSGVPQCGR